MRCLVGSQSLALSSFNFMMHLRCRIWPFLSVTGKDGSRVRFCSSASLIFVMNAQQQREVFGNGKVFAVARTPAQGLHGRGPIIALASDVLIFPEPDAAVEKIIDLPELDLRAVARAVLEELLPVPNRLQGHRAEALEWHGLHPGKIDSCSLYRPRQNHQSDQDRSGKAGEVFRFCRSGKIQRGYQLLF